MVLGSSQPVFSLYILRLKGVAFPGQSNHVILDSMSSACPESRGNCIGVKRKNPLCLTKGATPSRVVGALLEARSAQFEVGFHGTSTNRVKGWWEVFT